ncbi:unnamed protein product [Lactuca virosa]|uniref:non-specific serine/threonine protein kinase n=1 Tax=Lactuca virosa TaxID=75947 RepID=A0AAU9NY80_9ASTR|nr:unnamed protein product [Lactuca virosa]
MGCCWNLRWSRYCNLDVLNFTLFHLKTQQFLQKTKTLPQKPTIPNISKEIREIRIDPTRTHIQEAPNTIHKQHHPGQNPYPESDSLAVVDRHADDESKLNGYQKIQIDIGKKHRISYPEKGGGGGGGGSSHESGSGDQLAPISVQPEVSHLGWGHWYTLRELEIATNGFADENVIGEGGYGIVYCGVLVDKTTVAVKNLLNNRGQAEREFKELTGSLFMSM